MFYSVRANSKMDSAVRQLCVDKDNCRRKKMLEAIGSLEDCQRDECCCDCCGADRLSPKLKFECVKPVSTAGRKRRCAVFSVTDEAVETLKEALRNERDKYMDNHRSFITFGPDCVCCDSLIDHICMQAKFVKVESDLV